MSSETYAIVFSGGIVDGFQLISVKAHLAKLLKADIDKMAVLFSGKTVVLKRTADKQEALKYGSALKRIGADVKIRVVKAPPQSAVQQPAAQPPALPVEEGLSLAPLGGNLVAAKTAPPLAQFDISDIELAEEDGSTLAPPRPVHVLELDLSELSIRELDGAPLVEPKPEPPKVAAPDFSLDEPGAMLETISEQKEPLNPDTSDLSIAEPGVELLGPDDKSPGTPPNVPDTSSIHLVPNVD